MSATQLLMTIRNRGKLLLPAAAARFPTWISVKFKGVGGGGCVGIAGVVDVLHLLLLMPKLLHINCRLKVYKVANLSPHLLLRTRTKTSSSSSPHAQVFFSANGKLRDFFRGVGEDAVFVALKILLHPLPRRRRRPTDRGGGRKLRFACFSRSNVSCRTSSSSHNKTIGYHCFFLLQKKKQF